MSIAVLDAPSDLGLRLPPSGVPSGVSRLPEALRARGLIQRLGATDSGVVPAPASRVAGWDLATGVFNEQAIAEYSGVLSDRVAELTAVHDRLVVLGGDCSILLGIMQGLSRDRPLGLVFVDAHGDFRHQGNSPFVDAAAGEELALLTGRGGVLAHPDGRDRVIDDDAVAVLGLHDPSEDLSELRSTIPFVWTVDAIRRNQPVAAAERALASVLASGVEAIWVHVDADVLDERVLPAVDSPEPGGLEADELVELLLPLFAHPSVAGLDLTIYDPSLDTGGEGAELLAGILERVVAARG
jgi:arginase